MTALQAYKEACELANQTPDPVELLAWQMFGFEPEWYAELKNSAATAKL